MPQKNDDQTTRTITFSPTDEVRGLIEHAQEALGEPGRAWGMRSKLINDALKIGLLRILEI